MIEIKKGHYLLNRSIVQVWENEGYKYITGKSSELFIAEGETEYVNIKVHWKAPHPDNENIFVYPIGSEKIQALIDDKYNRVYLVSYQQI